MWVLRRRCCAIYNHTHATLCPIDDIHGKLGVQWLGPFHGTIRAGSADLAPRNLDNYQNILNCSKHGGNIRLMACL